jgi:Cellulase (glycosyl hydrolase family 5)
LQTSLIRTLLVMAALGIGALGCNSSTPSERFDIALFQDASPQREDFGYTVRIRPWDLSDAELTEALDLAQSAGVNTIDFEASWGRLDQGDSGGSRRTYDWYQADRLVSAARARDMQVTFILTQTPDWVHPNLQKTVPDGDDRMWFVPKGETELQHWSNFVRDVVGRYGEQVSHFEVWNEPNAQVFWKPYPDAGEYAALLREAYLSAKDKDPTAKIVFGGLAENSLGYLNEYYRVVKASYHDAASHSYFFDVLGVHPYADDRSPQRYTQDAIYEGEYGEVDKNFMGFVRMRELMEDQGDSGKNLLLSEYGFSTTDTWMDAVSDSRRALYLKQAYEQARSISYVEGLSWYAYHPNPADGPEWAIVDEDFDPSLTFRALKQVTGAEESTVKLTITLPEEVSSTTYSIEPQLTDLHNADVSHWELYVDGILVGEQHEAPIRWDTRGAEAGLHELMVVAYTNEGSVWHSNIVETKLVF